MESNDKAPKQALSRSSNSYGRSCFGLKSNTGAVVASWKKSSFSDNSYTLQEMFVFCFRNQKRTRYYITIFRDLDINAISLEGVRGAEALIKEVSYSCDFCKKLLISRRSDFKVEKL